MSLLKLSDVNFRYNSIRQGAAFELKNINLDLFSKDFLGILGPNGCGKSTLIRIMCGLLKPNSGTMTLENQDFTKIHFREKAKKIAFVPQNINTIFPFTVYEIVAMGRTPYLNMLGFESKRDKEKIAEALKLLELEHLANRGINEISGGEAQRVFIARALAQEPEIVMLDEPNAHLDLKHQINIFKLLADLNSSSGLTVVIISHDLNLTGHFCKRVIMMKQGQIIKGGKTESLLTEDNIEDIFDVRTEVKYGILNKPQINIIPS
ncbi:MAG: ABC transporter ATP-binding protein [Bacteroidota bacterium]